MIRKAILLVLGATCVGAAAPTSTPRDHIIGVVQPEIRLANGSVFKNAKVLGASLEKGTATLSDATRVEQVPGWQKLRASGDASFSVWDNSRRDYLWRTEKFEVEFAIIDGTALKLDTVTFGGISRSADID